MSVLKISRYENSEARGVSIKHPVTGIILASAIIRKDINRLEVSINKTSILDPLSLDEAELFATAIKVAIREGKRLKETGGEEQR